MGALRLGIVALILVAAGAGCGRGTAPDQPTASGRATSHAATSAPATVTSPPSRPAVSSSAPPRIPAVSANARAAGLVDVRTVIPDAIIDLRYATTNNFVGVPLYPPNARCLVHQSMVAGLRAAAVRLSRSGQVLVFWDCYRPHPVQVRMFQIVPDPTWVARPGPFATSHEAARSVDVTLARAAPATDCPAAQQVQRHCVLDMGTDFDDFSPRAHAFATDGVSPQAQANRARLRTAMDQGAITGYDAEWWHYDGPGADVTRPQLDVSVN